MTRPHPSRLAGAVSWAVLAGSFGLSAATWISLARLAGLAGPLPGGADLAWLMPAVVDGYVVVALLLWMAPVPERVARFARANTYAAASIGVAAQSAYHALTIWDSTGVMWRATLAAIVGALPPAGAALTIHMRSLLARELTALETTAVPEWVAEETADPVDPWTYAEPVATPPVDAPTKAANELERGGDAPSPVGGTAHTATPPVADTPPATEDTATPAVRHLPRHRHTATKAAIATTEELVAEWAHRHGIDNVTAKQAAAALGLGLRTAERHLAAARRNAA